MNKYSPVFKQQAVQRAEKGDQPVPAIARELGIPQSTLYYWCKIVPTPRYAPLCQWCQQPLPSDGHGNQRYHAHCLPVKRRVRGENPEQQRKRHQRWVADHKERMRELVRASYHRQMADPEKRAAYNARKRARRNKRI